MEKLLTLKADVLCEGHFGVYRTNEKVTDYIERCLDEHGRDPLKKIHLLVLSRFLCPIGDGYFPDILLWDLAKERRRGLD